MPSFTDMKTFILAELEATVSVIVPLCNRRDGQMPDGLMRALESVSDQTLQPVEILVVDDASSSKFKEKIAVMEDRFSLVRVIRLDIQRGDAGARNAGMRAAKGDYIAFLEPDDWWFPEKLERQLSAMLRGQSRFSTTAYNVIKGESSTSRAVELCTPNTVTGLESMVWGCTVRPGSTAVFHRDICHEIGDQDETLACLADWDWMIRVSLCMPVLVLNEPLSVVKMPNRPSFQSVRDSIRVLLNRYSWRIARHRLDLGLKFISSAYIELAAAAKNNAKRTDFILFGILAILIWPLRDLTFYRRAARTLVFSNAPSPVNPSTLAPNPKIVHIISSLESGGAERMLTNLVLHDSRMDKETRCPEHVVIALRSGGKYVSHLRSAGIQVEFLELQSIFKVLRSLRHLRQMVREYDPDLIKCWMYHANIFGLFARAFSNRLKRPALLWGIRCSDMDFSKYSRTLRFFVRLGAWLSSHADAIVINNCAGIRFHRQLGFNNAFWILLNNGIDPAEFEAGTLPSRREMREKFDLPHDSFVVGTLARNDVMKGYDILFTALTQLDGVTCVAAGKDTKYLEGPASFRGLNDLANVREFLSSIDIFVLASRFGEGFSNALTEAMAMGCPIIATDVGDNARVVGSAGIIIPPNDPNALKDAIQKLKDNPALAATLGAKARQRILERFTLTEASRMFQEIVHRYT